VPAEQGTENLSVVYDHRGPHPVNAVIENGRSVTELMGFLVFCFFCVPHVTANERQFAQQICSEALSAAGPSFHRATLTAPSQGGETRNETEMNSRPVQDELFITPGLRVSVPARQPAGARKKSAARSRCLRCTRDCQPRPRVVVRAASRCGRP
jgi:hypothetical protein